MSEKTKLAADDPLVKEIGKLLKAVAFFGMNVAEHKQQAIAAAMEAGDFKSEAEFLEKAVPLMPLTGAPMQGLAAMMEGGRAVSTMLEAAGITKAEMCDCDDCKIRKAYREKHNGAEMPDPTVIYAGSA